MKTDLIKYLSSTETSFQSNEEFFNEINAFKNELLNRATCKTPTAIAKAMLAFFFEIFTEAETLFASGAGAVTKKKFLAAHDGTWVGLEKAAKEMARLVHKNDHHLHFWDRMRHASLEFSGDHKEREWRQASRAIDSDKSFEEAYRIKDLTHCDYCWRTVPHRRGKSKVLKCHLHADKEKGAALTQKSREILKKMNVDIKDKSNILLSPAVRDHLEFFSPHACPPNCIARKDWEWAKKNHYTLMDTWSQHADNLICKFPHVKEYLVEAGVDICSSYEVVRAIDMPLDISKSKSIVCEQLTAFRLLDDFYQFYARYIESRIRLDEDVEQLLRERHIDFSMHFEILSLFEEICDKDYSNIYSSAENKFVRCIKQYYDAHQKQFISNITSNSSLMKNFDELLVNVDSPVEVAWGLERVCYPKDRSDTAEHKKQYHQQATDFFDTFWPFIVLAERWLAVEASLVHGGKRAGAGRKPKT